MPVDDWPTTSRRAQELEALGFDHLWIYDHLSWQNYRDEPWHGTIPWLTALAACTETIEIGTMVASPNLRHPLMLAKEAMSIDHVSNGRLVLGIGAGTAGFDAAVFGDAALSTGQRSARFEEYVHLLDGLLRGTVQNHVGDWYRIDEGRVLPGCVRRPRLPLAVAASGPRSMRVAAAVAETWVTVGSRFRQAETPAEFLADIAQQSIELDKVCADAGRDLSTLGRLVLLPGSITAALGSAEAIIDAVGQAAEAGFTAVLLHDHRAGEPPLDLGEGTIEQVMAWKRTWKMNG